MASSSIDSNTLFRVDGIVAVITGGGTGIGLTMARALAFNEPARSTSSGAAKTSSRPPPKNTLVWCHSIGYVNLVVANSGTIGPPVRFNPSHSVPELRDTLFENFSMEEMTQTLHLNVTAAFFTMTAFLELLDAGNKNAITGGFGEPLGEEVGSGVQSIQSQVIFTTSISAFSRHWSSSPPYLTSKVAIMQVTKHASTQLARFGIRVNAIAPGIYPSELASVLISTRKPEEETIDDPRFIPARFGGDEEMAGAILYLASRSGSYSNGSILITDGGRLSVMGSTY
ncbi:related to gluconate 5-dehydrogenase [Cephalotrichum gorgonifer]|uniref:Related to gluconate 5-dehydrogenase n=1 Tax=Cephalotrichum gorgonifer TaxID=2041049 RepID=A0AAE8SUC4_9PEZI|nr:related to gluconate 5-dehydrogenase [Cephalotrichum gorgonifer]